MRRSFCSICLMAGGWICFAVLLVVAGIWAVRHSLTGPFAPQPIVQAPTPSGPPIAFHATTEPDIRRTTNKTEPASNSASDSPKSIETPSIDAKTQVKSEAPPELLPPSESKPAAAAIDPPSIAISPPPTKSESTPAPDFAPPPPMVELKIDSPPISPAKVNSTQTNEPALAQPAIAPPPKRATCPWTLHVAVVDDRSRIEVCGKSGEVLFQTNGKSVNVAAPLGVIELSGDVHFSGFGLGGTCERLLLSWQADELQLEGNVRARRLQSSAEEEFLAERMRWRVDFSGATKSKVMAPTLPLLGVR